MEKIEIEPQKIYYQIINERGVDLNKPLNSFHAPNIPDGTYDSDTLFEWQNVGFKELTKGNYIAVGTKVNHQAIQNLF